ncbi:hypothetical protein ARMGADRAFT_1020410 [Armillaria gallica]|uniref:Uncharacterized protein n=1 Tax=Armillaria gallica TaxID=47427 RepID=A0A2H3CYV7_ARMGA|nr:hypothetical protein ARMGADRAFT_1020408 [Armillaria gallica]PBK81275.1 hypothetical protein ARMGADRAFT_1020410 [Armillaria gallica]
MATFSPHIYKKDRIRIFDSHYLPLDTARTSLQATDYFETCHRKTVTATSDLVWATKRRSPAQAAVCS